MKKISIKTAVLVGSLSLFFGFGIYFSKTLQPGLSPKNIISTSSSIIGGGVPVYSKMADAIVIGVVDEVGKPYWQEEAQDKNHDMIQRDVTLHVEEVLKGNDMEGLTLVLQGGTIDDTEVIAGDEAKLRKGERVLLFVGTNADEEYVVFAGAAGKYLIDADDNARNIDTKMPLEDLKADISDALEEVSQQ